MLAFKMLEDMNAFLMAQPGQHTRHWQCVVSLIITCIKHTNVQSVLDTPT